MKRTLLASTLLAAALALPLAALAEDAPGVFKVPGTDSTIKFYGYVQLDGTVDFGGRPPDIENWDWASILPGVPADNTSAGKRKPQTYLTARTSRFGIQTSTPSKYGNIGVKLEGDFNGPNGFQSETYTNSVVFRLRQAYGTMGNLLIGQTWSTFLDMGAYPDVVDFNGPGTIALIRNPMIRYTIPFSDAMNLALAVENNRGLQHGNDDTQPDPVRFQSIPDLHANLTYNAGWGHLSVRGVAQTYTRQLFPDTAAPTNKNKVSISGAVSGSVKFGGDTLVAQFAGGPGIGRYFFNAANTPFVSVDNNDALQLWTAYGYHLGFTHVWSGAMRSNLVWSQSFIQDPKLNNGTAPASQQKDFNQAFVNTFFTLTKTVEFGVEYEYGQWKSFGAPAVAALKGTENRVTGTFHYNFF